MENRGMRVSTSTVSLGITFKLGEAWEWGRLRTPVSEEKAVEADGPCNAPDWDSGKDPVVMAVTTTGLNATAIMSVKKVNRTKSLKTFVMDYPQATDARVLNR